MVSLAHLSTARLREMLNSDAAPLTEAALQHIEECDQCRSQLEHLAADALWWSRAAESLSSAGDERTWKSGVLAEGSPRSEGEIDTESILRHLDPPGHPELLGQIDHYEIEQLIGQGGMGVVFKALDRELHRPVAVKFLAPHLAASGVARQRFAREARAAAAVVHPNVVPIYAIHAGPRPYLVMALVAGRSLQSLVETQGPLTTREAVRISLQVAAGLAAAHKQGLIHRDIKPSNVLIDGEAGRVMITDFGLARAADDVAVTQTGWLAGTPHYMSPEQARGADLDPRSDLFSLGSAMYFLATGREPFRADKPLAILEQICRREPLTSRSLNCEIEAPLSAIIERLMEKRPQDRFQSAEEVRQVLEQYLAHLQHPRTHRCPRRLSTRKQRKRYRVGFVAGLLVVATISASLAMLRFGRTSEPQKPRWSAPDSAAMPDDLADIQTIQQYAREKLALEAELQKLTTAMTYSSPIVDSSMAFPALVSEIDAELRQLERLSKTWRIAIGDLGSAPHSSQPSPVDGREGARKSWDRP